MNDFETQNETLMDYLYDHLSPTEKNTFEKTLQQDAILNAHCQTFKRTLENFRASEQFDLVQNPQNQLTLSSKATQKILKSAKLQAREYARASRAPFFKFLFHPQWAYGLALLLVGLIGFSLGGRQEKLRQVKLYAQVSPISSHVPITRVIAEPVAEKKKITVAQVEKAAPQPAAPLAQDSVVLASLAESVSTERIQPVSPEVDNDTRGDSALTMGSAGLMRVSQPATTRSSAEMEGETQSIGELLTHAKRHHQQRQWQQALREYRMVAKMVPNSYESVFSQHQMARIYAEAGLLQRSEHLYAQLIENFPNYPQMDQMLLESAKINAHRGDWPMAYTQYKTLYERFPHLRAQVMPELQVAARALKLQQNTASDAIPVIPVSGR